MLRPWPADDGGLVRLRLVGGRVTAEQLVALAAVAAEYGDGDVHLTQRANLQVRGLPLVGESLPAKVVRAFEGTGLLPSRSHELIRNIMCSPLTGRSGGRADLTPLLDRLDAGLRADPQLAGLSARFLFVLDDGRGDLLARPADVTLVALDAQHAQLRLGAEHWTPVSPLADGADGMIAAARSFLAARGHEGSAAWHVDELRSPLPIARAEPDPRAPAPAAPLPFGRVEHTDPPLCHVQVPDGVLRPAQLGDLVATGADPLIVTPWHGVIVPDEARN